MDKDNTLKSEKEGTPSKGGESIGKRIIFNDNTLPYYIIGVMMLLFVVIGIGLTFGLKESNQCLNNPLTYGVNKIENNDTGILQCTCSFSNPSYAPFYFNNKDIGVLDAITFNNNR
ncbi:hypothetical protein LCGC14_1387910 [marine sediment metagenome]|uniref:Uncharacterized protein n=1 Tax=marine sediment metagenome TaxID=412755 RepID=A0A0F9MGB9_9ZZZZ